MSYATTDAGVSLTHACCAAPSRKSQGRAEEEMGEDTYLAGELVSAMVSGMVGGDYHNLALNTTTMPLLKHYAAHSVPEGGINLAPAHIGRRELRETFLPVFAKVSHPKFTLNREAPRRCVWVLLSSSSAPFGIAVDLVSTPNSRSACTPRHRPTHPHTWCGTHCARSVVGDPRRGPRNHELI